MNLKQISNLFLDIEGIFSNGSLYVPNDAINTIKFYVHDGLGCILLKEGEKNGEINI